MVQIFVRVLPYQKGLITPFDVFQLTGAPASILLALVTPYRKTAGFSAIF